MVRIGSFSALLDVGPLLHGVLHYQRLRIADTTVVLERDPQGVGNWKFGGDGGSGGLGLVPKDRTQFPTLIDFMGERALITYRTRSGNILDIRLDRVAISSPSDETPVRLQASGAYNDVATRLDATTDSYEILRDAGEPFGTRFVLAGKDTDIAFNGTMQEPLDFEGVHGELSIDARTLDDIMGIMGSQGQGQGAAVDCRRVPARRRPLVAGRRQGAADAVGFLRRSRAAGGQAAASRTISISTSISLRSMSMRCRSLSAARKAGPSWTRSRCIHRAWRK